MPKQTITDIDPKGQRVLIRVDFNVPLDNGALSDDTRIKAAIPTIKSVIDRGGRAVLMSHLGRPKGEGHEPGLSLKPAADRLAELLGKPVGFPTNDCVGAATEAAINDMTDGDVILLENLRFHAGEKEGDTQFAAQLASSADVYVNDAFGTCHRNDASMVAVPAAMEGKPRVAGLLVIKEIKHLTEATESPERPYVVALGGAKVSDKLAAIENLLPKADEILIGGAMAYTFLDVLGKSVGKSRVEDSSKKDAHRILEHAAKAETELYLPEDHICSTLFAERAGDIQIFEETIPDDYMGLDIGPKTQAKYSEIISKAKTIAWNGPMGVFEWMPFRVGTTSIAKAMARATANGATTVVGGGDSAAAVEKAGVADQITHVSTGGGASLAMLEGKHFESFKHLDDA